MSLYLPLAPKEQPAPVVSKSEDDVTRFARIAVVIGGLLTLAITAGIVACTLWGWVDTAREFFGWWLSLLALAWTIAAGFGAWWTFSLKVHRPVKLEDEALGYQYAALFQSQTAPVQVAPAETIRVEIVKKVGGMKREIWADLPCTRDSLTALARGLSAGKPFSEAEWTGTGKPFSRGEHGTFTKLREAFIDRGIMAWKDPEVPTLGMEPTKAGWALFRHLSPTQAGNGTQK